MTRLAKTARTRAVLLRSKGFTVKRIQERLKEDGVLVSSTALFKFFAKHRKTGTVADLPRATRPTKLSREQYTFIDEMTKDNKRTARKMRQLLEERWPVTIVYLLAL